jgi:magnesium chelatase family protein
MVSDETVRPFDPAAPPDLADVQNQETAKRALEIAAAGGHPILVTGPSGSGKTLLCRCLPALLPAWDDDARAAIAGTFLRAKLEPPGAPPLRAPHPSITPSAIIGGQRPGEVDLARGGVLFLDDLDAFGRRSLRVLRERLEEHTPPAQPSPPLFLLAAAMRSCPCGCLGDPHRECACARWQRERHWSAVRELLVDLFHLHVELFIVGPPSHRRRGGEGTAQVADRVRAARDRQRERHGGALLNAHLPVGALPEVCRLDAAGQQLLDRAAEHLPFTARTTVTALQVARSIADLSGRDSITAPHLAEAIHYQRRGGV